MEQGDVRRDLDYLVIGAGPAGVQLAYFLRRAGRRYKVLEAGDGPGTFFRRYPRNRTLISINKRYTGFDDPEVNLRWDWNSLLEEGRDAGPRFTEYTDRYFPPAERLVDYLADFVRRHELAISYGTRVSRISRPDGTGDRGARAAAGGEGARFVVETEQGDVYRARRLVVATGLSRPHVPAVPGIELADSYSDAPQDPQAYANQHVLILGKGNSGFETAEEMIATAAVIHLASPESVRFAWQTHYVGHLRALNTDFLDTYQLKCQNAVLDASVERIRRLEDGRLGVTVSYSHAMGEREELRYDRVIACTGFQFDDRLFAPECRPELVAGGRFPAQTAEWESTNVPDLFFAGTLMQARDYKKTTSAFIHGFRYNVRTLHRLLGRRYHGAELPYREVPATVEGIGDEVLARVNRTSALWQQFGFLADAVVVPVSGPARWYEELPVDWVRGNDPSDGALEGAAVYLVTLEFGPKQVDPFQIERAPEPDRAGDSAFLHPVVRRLEGAEDAASVHLLEHLYGEWWDENLHRQPLLEFLDGQLAPPLVKAG